MSDTNTEALMDDGENQAVRTFLQLYGCSDSIDVGRMRDHMEMSGWKREAFEELLGEYWSLAYSEGKDGVSHGDKANEVLHKLRTMYRSTLPPAVQVPQWISVKDRMPDQGARVLTYDPHRHVLDMVRVNGYWRNYDAYTDEKGYGVTHWMPLPTSPTSQGGENG